MQPSITLSPILSLAPWDLGYREDRSTPMVTSHLAILRRSEGRNKRTVNLTQGDTDTGERLYCDGEMVLCSYIITGN